MTTQARQGYSQGCFTCRKRKVKCDEGRPSCARCLKRGETCPGYRDKSQFLFRSMNTQLAAKAGHVVQPAEPARLDFSGLATYGYSQPQLGTGIEGSATPLATRQLATDWEQQAVAHFFHNYILSPFEGRRGYMDFLPDMFAQSEDGSALKHAVLAAAQASFGNVSGLGEFKTSSQNHYGLALKAIQQTLNDSTCVKSDFSLTSILVLQLFETINGLGNREHDHHEEALLRIHELRSEEELATSIGQQLSFVVRSRIYVSELTGGRMHSPPIEETDVHGPPAPPNGLWQIFANVSRICRQIQHLVANSFREDLVTDTALEFVFEQASKIYKELSIWPTSIPPEHRHRNVPCTKAYPPVYHLFNNIEQASMWIVFWCSKIRFLQRAKTLLETFGTHHTSSEDFQLNQLDDSLMITVDHICGSSAYMLGALREDGTLQSQVDYKAFGALILLRGLFAVTELRSLLSDDQKNFILGYLLQIGHSKGITMALCCRDRLLDPQLVQTEG